MADYPYKKPETANSAEKLKLYSREFLKSGMQTIESKLMSFDTWINFFAERYSDSYIKNMNIADGKYQEDWFKMSRELKAKRVYSEQELTNFINNRDKRLLLCDKLGNALVKLKEIQGKIKLFEQIASVSTSLLVIGQEHSITLATENLPDYKKLRVEITDAREKFLEFFSIIDVINSYSPPGMEEYIEMITSSKEGFEKLFSLADQYTALVDQLIGELDELEKLSNKTHSSFLYNIMMAITSDGNELLDLMEKNRSEQDRMKQEKEQERQRRQRRLNINSPDYREYRRQGYIPRYYA
ncbi:hypothetical protein SDC9_68460 [bioreactor metagenome]|uniref:Uncharacterized protein n=1 Tax=bioreactor metagenome TaxID=1076179 RepID=A0A644Y0H4_9ZZZZ